MIFAFDTGNTQPEVFATTWGVEETQRIVITTPARSRSTFNKIKANIEVHECPTALDEYFAREGLMLDALYLFDPAVTAELTEIYETHRSCLEYGGAARPALPGNSTCPQWQTDKETK